MANVTNKDWRSTVASLLEKFSNRLTRVASETRQNTDDINKIGNALVTTDTVLHKAVKEVKDENDARETRQTLRDQNNVQALHSLRDSTQKGFDQVKGDVESLLRAIQRLNERVGQVESQYADLLERAKKVVVANFNQPSAIDQQLVNSKLEGVYNVTEELEARLQKLEVGPCAAFHHMVGIEKRVAELEKTNVRAELTKSLPLIYDLMNNSSFVKVMSEAGYTFDSALVLRAISE